MMAVVVVVTMLVVMVVMIVPMFMMRMVMVLVVVMLMIMIMSVIAIMPVRMSALGMIGAARRLEGLVDIEHHRAQSLQHRADDMIAQDHDAILLDLGREMTVAEMPGEFDQMHTVATADFEQLLVGGKDFDQLAVLANQHVAIGEKHWILEIEHHHLAVLQMQELAAQVPQIVRQLDLCGRVRGRGAGGEIRCDALHDISVKLGPRPCKIALRDASTNARFVNGQSGKALDSGCLQQACLVRPDTLHAKAVFDKAVPGMVQPFPLMNDTIAAERLGEIERLIGRGINRLLVASL
jgi:hypothetical protein